MDLFDHAQKVRTEAEAPLAHRMRPRTLDEFVGQEHIIGPGRLLRRAIQADQLSSVIFYGPPGTGKTTLASIIAHHTRSHFISINAVLAGVKEIREAIDEALRRRKMDGRRTTLFVDEVHRWNKAQQDALLPHVENGTILLIGATTENPYFEVNKALVSRSRIFQLRPLGPEDLKRVALQAIADPTRGFGKLSIEIEPRALEHMVDVANGDARGVLNALELAVETTPEGEDGKRSIDLSVAEESIQHRAVLYDKDGDVHYDTISAFIKSLRGSDPDAALYWMARMVYAGEDPRFILRRMAIFASEDVGLADPGAVRVVADCWNLYERIGMPEGRFHLSQAALYLATCPKSNSTMAFFDALASVESEAEADVPIHLKDASRDKEGFGHGEGYLYPHAFRDHWVAQQYLPTALQGRVFYDPGDQGHEGGLRESVARRRELQLAAMIEAADDAAVEVLSTSPKDRNKDAWITRTLKATGGRLEKVREETFRRASIQRHHLVLIVPERTGLLTWEAVRRAPEGGVHALAPTQTLREMLEDRAKALPELDRPQVRVAELADAAEVLQREADEMRFDRILVPDAFTRSQDVSPVTRLAARLRPGGRLLISQVVPRHGQRLSRLLRWDPSEEALRARVEPLEESLFADASDPMTRWNAPELVARLEQAGLAPVSQVQAVEGELHVTRQQLEDWLGRAVKGRERPSYADRLASLGLPGSDVERLSSLFWNQLRNQTVPWRTTVLWVEIG